MFGLCGLDDIPERNQRHPPPHRRTLESGALSVTPIDQDHANGGGTSMAKSRKVIITCAVTGSIHTPSMTPHLPVTPEQIADAAIGAAEAGAAIVHLHARNPKDGRPDQTPAAFAPFLKVIKQRSNVVVNITTGGAPTMTPEERVRPAATLKPEGASLNMGTKK